MHVFARRRFNLITSYSMMLYVAMSSLLPIGCYIQLRPCVMSSWADQYCSTVNTVPFGECDWNEMKKNRLRALHYLLKQTKEDAEFYTELRYGWYVYTLFWRPVFHSPTLFFLFVICSALSIRIKAGFWT